MHTARHPPRGAHLLTRNVHRQRCNGSMTTVTLGTATWFMGLGERCTVDLLNVHARRPPASQPAPPLRPSAAQTTGPNVHIENVEVANYGSIVGVGLELVNVTGAFAVSKPRDDRLDVDCTGLNAINSRVAVAACTDSWSASGPNAVTVYQDASAPIDSTGYAGRVISVDRYTNNLFGRAYETRFYEGVTDVRSSRDLMDTALIFLAVSAGTLTLSWWFFG